MATTAVDPHRLGDAARVFEGSLDGLDLRCEAALRSIAAALGQGAHSEAAHELGDAVRSLLVAVEAQQAVLGRGIALAGAAYDATEAHIAAATGMP
ncbi:hypothetical protein [Rudaeicoccus suwonensis]|uniref:Excreted virulence factor EspC (Type VII ESX diderm) n=1 Tax=Rudaeicoccus suwonensis TaxID=657409 RepID=A0A561E9F4_9MICO|nr:hypothetical protein [Rudaeicoccus suwonensis]TWE12243.1 hypothetical protein BKA23_1043 [Rudaeicoccus suwonensis]